MLKYGSDKPDLRFDLEIVDIGDLAQTTAFQVFRGTLEAGGKVRCLNAAGAANKMTRKNLDDLTEFVKRYGGKGCAWVRVEETKFTAAVEKFFEPDFQQKLRERMKAKVGDLLLFVADKEEVVCQALGNLRIHLASLLKLLDPGSHVGLAQLLGFTDFPSFIWD